MPSPHNEAVSNVLRLTQLWLNGWRHKRVAPSPSTRWLMEQAAAWLGTAAPESDDEEFDWVSRTFSQASAMTLYVAARGLADRGQRVGRPRRAGRRMPGAGESRHAGHDPRGQLTPITTS